MKKSVKIGFICILVILLGTLGFFTYRLFFAKETILVPDFTDKNKQDVQVWCNSLEVNPCTFENDYSDTVAENGIIYQSIAADQELEEAIKFVVSLGKKIEIVAPTVDKDTTKETIKKWIEDNRIKNPIQYVEKESEGLKAGAIISIEPALITSETQTIIITVAKGDENEKSDEGDIKIDYGTYLDLSEDEFKKKAKELNLTANHNTDRDDYSNTIEKGKIVWHGSGYYVKNETFNYGLSLGKNDGAIVVKSGDYVGLSLDEFTTAVSKLGTEGLTPKHVEDRDEYSSTIAKGYIVWHGAGTYEEKENISYGLSKGSENGYFTIEAGQFKGKTFEQFEKAIKAMGLTAEHSKTRSDEYSDTVDKDCILWHGNASDFKAGEVIHYTLSKGKKDDTASQNSDGTITIKQGTYIGKTYSEFETAVKALGLTTRHRSEWDEYSDTVTKGNIVRNGYGDYTKGEACSYGLSLGSKTQPVEQEDTKTVTITSGQYNGKTTAEFESAIKALGLEPVYNSSKDINSTITVGNVAWHSVGTYELGSYVYYGVSKGEATVSVLSLNDLADKETSTYDGTSSNLRDYFVNKCGFSSSNVTITGAKSQYTAGIIISIDINNQPLPASGGQYPTSSKVSIVISTGQD